MLQSMGSQRVGHDLTTEQQQCKDRRNEGSIMKKYIKQCFYLSFIGHKFRVCWEVKLNSPFQRKSVTLLCRQFGRNEMYFARSVAQSCPTLCDPMDYRPTGLSVHGILSMAKIPAPGDLPDPGIEPVCLLSPLSTGRFFTSVPLRKPPYYSWS